MRSRGLVGCIKCGGSYHPFSYVRANPLCEALPLQCGPFLQCAIDETMARLFGFTMYGLVGTVLAFSALGMTHSMISFLNFCTPQYFFNKSRKALVVTI